jgi:hypothetical protein
MDAGWYPDPNGRHHRRFFTGVHWTEHVVSAAGQLGVDRGPIDAATPAGPARAEPVPAAPVVPVAPVPVPDRDDAPLGSRRVGAVLGIIGTLVIVAIVVVARRGGDEKTTVRPAGDQRQDAFERCTGLVTERLHADTITFRPYAAGTGEVSVTVAGSTYTVESTADAPDGAGTIVRHVFTCEVTETSASTFTLVRLEVS